jgi:hypothetical protein
VEEIATALGARVRGVRVRDVTDVLTRLAERRVVEWT